MPIRACWNIVVAQWKRWRPTRRRKTSSGVWAEAFESRRLLSAFFVNSLADSSDANLGDGIAADAKGFTTLRAAIEEANSHLGADTITLPAGVIPVGQQTGLGFVITDELTIVDAGTGHSVIDGSALNQLFEIQGSGRLHLSGVRVRGELTIPRPTLITTNPRQTDLIVAFSATPGLPLAVETKNPNGLSPLVGIVVPKSEFDEIPFRAKDTRVAAFDLGDRRMKPDDAVLPTPDAAIDDIVNALFHNEPNEFMLPTGSEDKSTPLSVDRKSPPTPMPMPEDGAMPMPSSDELPPKVDEGSPIDGMMSLFDSSEDELNMSEDDAVAAVLRGWANEAGWSSPDFWTSRSATQLAVRPAAGRTFGALAAIMLSGISTQSWTTAPRWLSRLTRLRRKPR